MYFPLICALIINVMLVAPTMAETLTEALPEALTDECSECWWETSTQFPLKWHKPDGLKKASKETASDKSVNLPSARRHNFVMQYGIETRYQNMINPIKATHINFQQGEKLYNEDCSSCHGLSGHGDGSISSKLKPEPADLAHLIKMSMMTSDSYLYWTIAEGGVFMNTSMPAFKTTRSESDIWKIIIYLRNELSK